MPINVKICGLTTADATDAALEGGAFAVGFVFFPSSPRSITAAAAASLARRGEGQAKRVGLFVDPEDAWLDAVIAQVPLDVIQLHGRETVARTGDIRQRLMIPVIKAVPVSSVSDVAVAESYQGVADWILFDSRPPSGSDRPGGNALAFDWSLLGDVQITRPWLLAGGLSTGNLAAAIRATGAKAVDVSSGVESEPGRKSPDKIRAFLAQAAGL